MGHVMRVNVSEEKSKLIEFFLQESNVDMSNPPAVMVELAHRVVNVILSLIDIPNHKILYIINTAFAIGLRENISRYGIRYTKLVHDTLVEAVQQHLTEGVDIEFEWTETQYNNFVMWKPEYEK